MVQIVIKRDVSLDEHFIIELQGELKVKAVNDKLSNKFIGDLHFSKEDIPILIIGHHILYGKCVTLDKPLAVMQKLTSASRDQNTNDDAGETSTEYRVQAIIKRKLEFRCRPKPIVVMPQAKS